MISRSSVSRLAVLGAAALLTAGGSGIAAAAVQDPVPVGPQQFFSGMVNGENSPASIRTDCVGPVVAGQTGHPVSGQYVEAVLGDGTTTQSGYTGASAHSLEVLLGAAPSSTTVEVIGSTGNYFVPLAIPTTLTVPCGGTGQVTFVPQPTSPTADPATVTVSFISIGL